MSAQHHVLYYGPDQMIPLLAFAVAAWLPAQIASSRNVLVAPAGAAPILDGTIHDEEWRGAHTTRQGEIELRTRSTPDGGLALGIHAPAFAITTVYLRVGDTIAVLHASAAIGEATYARQTDGTWALAKEFAFTRYRDVADFSARHQGFLDEHRWVATHARLGAPGDTELVIAPAMLGATGDPRIAVTYYDPDAKRLLLTAPIGVADAVIQPEINAGFTAATLRFEPDTWMSLIGQKAEAPSADLDYASYYAQGISFTEFLAGARILTDEWRDTYRHATVDHRALARARALHGRWRLLVVADDSCHDSLNTVPYLAKLAEAAPGVLAMRVVSSTIAQPVKEAHQTPDGRAATPTVVVLDDRGAMKGVFIERPAALRQYLDERGQGLYPNEVRELRHRWYADDKGRHAVAEILDLIEK